MSSELSKETRIVGIPVSGGIAIGVLHFLSHPDEHTPDFAISYGEVDAEIARYRKAVFSSKEDLHKLQEDLVIEGSDEAVDCIETHIQMLDDPMITVDMEGKIRERLRNTESVFHSVIDDYKNRFSDRTNAFFQERLVDITDISKRILGHLTDKKDTQPFEIPVGSIVVAEEISPSYTAAAQPSQIGAIITQKGGGNSHAALIARSKGIPYIANVDIATIQGLRVQEAIVDGFDGVIILNPMEQTLAHYREKQKQLVTRYQRFLDEDHLTAQTRDGQLVQLLVNVGSLNDLDIYPYAHDGVGLFRSEYLFLATKEFYPSEKYQEEVYRELIHKANGKSVVIRVFDLGGDKHPGLFLERREEPNPIMGFRGIRFLLRNQKLFTTQLRAIFKAAIGKPVSLLLPLISDINELRQSKEIIEEVKQELRAAGIPADDLPIGCMVEVPSAVMICETLAAESDFLSIGTNDLVQYTLGVDRGNPSMSELYYPAHPSVLRMIKMIVTQAVAQNVPFTICGEIASNTLFTPLLLGLGLRHFSICPRYIPYIKETVRMWSTDEAIDIARQALALSDPKAISELLTRIQKKRKEKD